MGSSLKSTARLEVVLQGLGLGVYGSILVNVDH